MTHQNTSKDKKEERKLELTYLTIDLDIPFYVAQDIIGFIHEHIVYWSNLSRYKIMKTTMFPSQNYNTHISIKLDRPIDYIGKIHAELCLGSDIARAWYTWARWKLWQTKSDYLFTEKIKDRKEKTANIDTLEMIPITVYVPKTVYTKLRQLELKRLTPIEELIADAIYLFLASQE